MNIEQLAASVRQALNDRDQRIARLESVIASLKAGARPVEEEIDSIPGRRIPMHPTQTLAFTATDDNTRATALSFKLSQDGPFIMTCYPVVTWRVSAPSTATTFGRWRPVYSWDVPTQQEGATEWINISWELVDTGPQQNFQDNALPPFFSRLDKLMPLAKPCMFAPLSVIQFVPTFNDITFSAASTATTGGTLVVSLIGYRIFNR